MLFNYLDLRDETTRKAFAVANEINDRIEALCDKAEEEKPGSFEKIWNTVQASVCVTAHTLTVDIGGEVVWHDQNDSSDDLTADFCLRQFAESAMTAAYVATALAVAEIESAASP